jgi:hypothetical protein
MSIRKFGFLSHIHPNRTINYLPLPEIKLYESYQFSFSDFKTDSFKIKEETEEGHLSKLSGRPCGAGEPDR